MNENNPWYAHVTVATIIKKSDKYLMVFERTKQGERYNQPAGHLEENETLFEAAVRETKEETGYDVELTGFIRLNQYTSPANGASYIRVTFAAQVIAHDQCYEMDKDIIEAKWMSKTALLEDSERLRSPLVIADIEFYEQNTPLPLSYISIAL